MNRVMIFAGLLKECVSSRIEESNTLCVDIWGHCLTTLKNKTRKKQKKRERKTNKYEYQVKKQNKD